MNNYLERLEHITSIDGSASKKACEMLIIQAEKDMSSDEKAILHLIPYLNTDNIPIRILKYLLPTILNKDEKTILIDHFIRTLKEYSLISIQGIDDQQIITANGFTFMILKATQTCADRSSNLKTLLNFFMCYIDLDQTQIFNIKTEALYDSMHDFLNGNGVLQEHCKIIFNTLVEKGKTLPYEFVDTFIENKYRNTKAINQLWDNGELLTKDTRNNQLTTEVINALRSKNLIMESQNISDTFLVELLIRILYNSSKNKWLMELSKDRFSKPETGKLRHRLSCTFVPDTTESLMEHQLAHCLTQLLQQHLSSLPMQHIQDFS
ncbi:uncharacterized protein LOC127720836 [Mytilus californianus]|uniref:uncharacterized protein LOC127720836 n=1 Tax=Mytilus californianus TaxID=6549 RepID=UPI0022457485|nr:uncharacterized protein LOC127720836 [Mytilus californianus]